VDYTSGDYNVQTGKMAAAITLLVTGTLTLTVQYWAGSTHTWGGTNWAAAFSVTTTMLGLGQLLGGLIMAFWNQAPVKPKSALENFRKGLDLR
jgi:hypothetical protein